MDISTPTRSRARRAFGTWFLAIVFGLLAFALLVAGTAQAAASADAPPQILRYERPGHGAVNSWLLVGHDEVAIVDAQRSNPEAQAVIDMARGIGKPVRIIVLTHEHPDHIGGLAFLAGAFPQAELMASRETADFIRANGPEVVRQMRGIFGERFPGSVPQPARVLAPGERIRLGGVDWAVEVLGAGEAGSMTVLVSEARREAFIGDLAGNRMTPWLADGHVLAWMAQLRAAERRFAGFTLYPGHGAAAPAAQLLGEQLRYLADFVALVRRHGAGAAPPLSADAKARIRADIDAAYPGFLRVAPPPNLIDINADAVAGELLNAPSPAAGK